jgi:uncharacterized coiled-coil DUF342 family protein
MSKMTYEELQRHCDELEDENFGLAYDLDRLNIEADNWYEKAQKYRKELDQYDEKFDAVLKSLNDATNGLCHAIRENARLAKQLDEAL